VAASYVIAYYRKSTAMLRGRSRKTEKLVNRRSPETISLSRGQLPKHIPLARSNIGSPAMKERRVPVPSTRFAKERDREGGRKEEGGGWRSGEQYNQGDFCQDGDTRRPFRSIGHVVRFEVRVSRRLSALRPSVASAAYYFAKKKKKEKKKESERERERRKETATSKLANKRALRRYLIDWANQADVWRLDCAARIFIRGKY
jgi:hypothetical protein